MACLFFFKRIHKLSLELTEDRRMVASPENGTSAKSDKKRSSAAFFIDGDGRLLEELPKFILNEPSTEEMEKRKFIRKWKLEKRQNATLQGLFYGAHHQLDIEKKRVAWMRKTISTLTGKADDLDKQCGTLRRRLQEEERSKETDIVKKLRQQIEELVELENGRKECKVCYDEEVQVRFTCGHAACRNCANRLTHCHVCRHDLRTFVPIFSP